MKFGTVGVSSCHVYSVSPGDEGEDRWNVDWGIWSSGFFMRGGLNFVWLERGIIDESL